MRRRVYYSKTVGMGLRLGLVPAQYSAWVLTGTRGDRQEAVAHRITLLNGSCVGDISLSCTRYSGPTWVAFSVSYIIHRSSCTCIKVHNFLHAPSLHLKKKKEKHGQGMISRTHTPPTHTNANFSSAVVE